MLPQFQLLDHYSENFRWVKVRRIGILSMKNTPVKTDYLTGNEEYGVPTKLFYAKKFNPEGVKRVRF